MNIKEDFLTDANQTGHLWNNLSEAEKQELLIAYNESFDDANLLAHDQVKASLIKLKTTK